MKKEFKQAIKESVLKGFFDMAFIEVITIEKHNINAPIEFTNVFVISNSYPERIQLQFYFPLECKKMIVENIYTRLWHELPARVIDDCIMEMVNVIGGNFFSVYFGEDSKYDMGLPSLQFDDRDLKKGKDFYFNAENHFFKISLIQE